MDSKQWRNLRCDQQCSEENETLIIAGINDKWDKEIVSNYDMAKNDEIKFYRRARRPNQWPAVWDQKVVKVEREGSKIDITKIKDEKFKHMMSLCEFSGISGYGQNIDIIESIENDNDFVDIKWKNSIADKRTVNMYNDKESLDLDSYLHGSWTWRLNANDNYYNRRKDIRLLKRALDDDDKEAAGELAFKEKDIINVAINNEKSELFFMLS